MDRNLYPLVGIPKDELYRGLIDAALEVCPEFLLVLRQQVRLEVRAENVLARLQPKLLKAEMSTRWPGTELLFGDRAEIRHYRLDAESALVLKDAAKSLFDWIHPELPEDLCFMRPDGTPWLITTAHEHFADLSISSDERATISLRGHFLDAMVSKRSRVE
jgi:hypothetical protein